ncbi:MAG TPA: response regulator [Acidimicrobiales bacterium]
MNGRAAGDGPVVLVVDDEAGIRRALGAALTARGLSVAVAATGAEARAHLVTHRVDIVILDLGLPDVDGVALCREMRATTTVPIIVLTAEGSEARKVEAYLRVFASQIRKKLRDDAAPASSPSPASVTGSSTRPTRPTPERVPEAMEAVQPLLLPPET